MLTINVGTHPGASALHDTATIYGCGRTGVRPYKANNKLI